VLSLVHANSAKNLRKAWGLSQADLDLAGTALIGVVEPEEEEMVVETPLRPIVRMDQWCLVRDFFLSCEHMSNVSERLGQPHRSAYWLEQGKEFASRLGLKCLCRKYTIDSARLEQRRGSKDGGGGVKNLEQLFAAMDVEEVRYFLFYFFTIYSLRLLTTRMIFFFVWSLYL
jgi:hypothetical protein